MKFFCSVSKKTSMQVGSVPAMLIMCLRADLCQAAQMCSFCGVTENELEMISLLKELIILKETWGNLNTAKRPLKKVSKITDFIDGLGPRSRRKREKFLSLLNVEAAVVQQQIGCLGSYQ